MICRHHCISAVSLFEHSSYRAFTYRNTRTCISHVCPASRRTWAVIWSPYTDKDTEAIETGRGKGASVQRRFTKRHGLCTLLFIFIHQW